MADRRYIARDITDSSQVEALVRALGGRDGLWAALLFSWLIPHFDDDGRMIGDPGALRSKVFGRYMDLVTEAEITEALALMNDADLIVWYSVRDVPGERYVWSPKFTRHQTLRADRYGPSRHPAPPGWTPDADHPYSKMAELKKQRPPRDPRGTVRVPKRRAGASVTVPAAASAAPSTPAAETPPATAPQPPGNRPGDESDHRDRLDGQDRTLWPDGHHPEDASVDDRSGRVEESHDPQPGDNRAATVGSQTVAQPHVTSRHVTSRHVTPPLAATASAARSSVGPDGSAGWDDALGRERHRLIVQAARMDVVDMAHGMGASERVHAIVLGITTAANGSGGGQVTLPELRSAYLTALSDTTVGKDEVLTDEQGARFTPGMFRDGRLRDRQGVVHASSSAAIDAHRAEAERLAVAAYVPPHVPPAEPPIDLEDA